MTRELEPAVTRRILIGLILFALVIVSAGVGVVVAYWPQGAHLFTVPP
ncbi:MAG: hypothetical protein ACRETB_01045 [Steroidobacteraceae bacterium]